MYIVPDAAQHLDATRRAAAPRMSASSVYYAGLRTLGLPAAVRLFRNAAVVLCYHNVVADEQAALAGTGLHITQERFGAQMHWLAARYAVVPLHELIARIRAGRSLRKTAAITFDDAYVGVFDHALSVLADLDLPATIFVVTEAAAKREPFWWDHPVTARQAGSPSSRRWLGELRGDGPRILQDLGVTAPPSVPPATRPAGWDQIRAAAGGGIDLGVHSATHRALPRLTDAELQAEIVDSRESFVHHCGVEAEMFAYPYGLWDRRARSVAQAAGYKTALSLDPRLISPGTDPWALPRVNIPAQITDSAFQAWVTGWSPHRVPVQ